MNTLSESLLASIFDEAPIGDRIVWELATSLDAPAQLVRLAAVLAELPGDGARAAEARLDALLDAVCLAAASVAPFRHALMSSSNRDLGASDIDSSVTESDMVILNNIEATLKQLAALERDIVSLIKVGDHIAALSELIRLFGDMIYSLCVAESHDSAQAEDAAVEWFGDIYRDLQAFVERDRELPRAGGPGAFRTRLSVLACTRVLDTAKRTRRGAPRRPETDAASFVAAATTHVPPPSWKYRLLQKFAPSEAERRKSSS
jgi:hypothetical protein